MTPTPSAILLQTTGMNLITRALRLLRGREAERRPERTVRITVVSRQVVRMAAAPSSGPEGPAADALKREGTR